MTANITISKIEAEPDLGGSHRSIVTFNIQAAAVQTDLSIRVDRVGSPSDIAAEAQNTLLEFVTDVQEALAHPVPLG